MIVADNGSRDRTAEVARAWADRLPALHVCDASSRTGTNRARNIAARAARGDFLAFCDADDVAAEGWLEGLVEGAARFDLVGGWCDDVVLNDAMTRGWRLAQPHDQLPIALGFLPYAIGANLGVWASVHEAIGGWKTPMSEGNRSRILLAGPAGGVHPGIRA